ncbi:MAG: DUF885 domain-containing protein, partial [Bacteroidota bacterium]|nr:DUF885 domain-containing protein [Bacteroidota bacterium]
GKVTDNSSWTDYSLQAIEKRNRENNMFLDAIQSIDPAKLEEAERLNYDLIKNTLTEQKEGARFKEDLMPMNQMSGYHQTIAQVISTTPIANDKDYKDLISRLEKVPNLVDQLITLMDEGIKNKITPPRITLLAIPDQIDNLIAKDPTQSILLTNLKSYLANAPKDKQANYSSAAVKVIKDKVNPSLLKLKNYIEKTYIPNSRETVAIKELPEGEDLYNHRIRLMTTTSLTYQQIHEIGLQEVKRIRTAMDTLIKSTGFQGSFQDFMHFLRTDPQFYYESADELVDAYRVISKRIDPELPKLFGKLPRLPYGVLPVPSYDEKSQTTAYYMPGSNEAGRPGVFFANTYNLKTRPKWEMEALTIHEAVPGHHLQIALSQELENVPEFRKLSFYTAFVEGWGLYSESLGEEMGFYKDPYSKFGQLTYEMWRAVRLVVDTGIHGMGWTRQEAIDYFKDNAAKTEHDITVEIDRYIAWPAQALAYKIGELKIKELRAKAEAVLGDSFDIRSFHDAILENGAIPLEVLESKVNGWIADNDKKKNKK